MGHLGLLQVTRPEETAREIGKMGNKAYRFVMGLLLAGSALSSGAQAQTGVAHPKPVTTRDMCVGTPVFELIPSGPQTAFRTTNEAANGGFDPSAPIASCGPVTRAQPLICVDSTGTPVGNEELCSPGAQLDYESKNTVIVHRSRTPGLAYYTVDSTTLGGAPMITGVRITAGLAGNCIQIAEVEAYENGVNVALASNGGVATGTAPYSGSSVPARANDGIRPSSYPNIYHSQCNGGDSLVITFARPSPSSDARTTVQIAISTASSS